MEMILTRIMSIISKLEKKPDGMEQRVISQRIMMTLIRRQQFIKVLTTLQYLMLNII